MDDTLETFFLSLFHEGRFNTFSPVTYLDRKDITVIRPLIYAPEPEIIGAVRRHNIPVVPSPCPAAGYTQREEMKTRAQPGKNPKHKKPDAYSPKEQAQQKPMGLNYGIKDVLTLKSLRIIRRRLLLFNPY